MTIRECPEATPLIRQLTHALHDSGDPSQAHWLELIRGAYYSKQHAGGLSGWARAHNEEDLETLQASFLNMDDKPVMHKLWFPGSRNMVWNPFGVKFYSDPTMASDRRFRGVVTLAATDDVYVGFVKEFLQIVVYTPAGKVDGTGK